AFEDATHFATGGSLDGRTPPHTAAPDEKFSRATMAAQQMAPSLHEEYPALGFLYPSDWERNWKITWHTDFCLESIQTAIAICGIYIVLCFGGKWLMKDRKPFDLRIPLAAWNLALAIFSFIGSVRTVPSLLNTIYRHGIYHSVCAPPSQHYGHGPAGFWVMLFIFSKLPELVDTAFIVLRKKPLIFLHWYHHITVLLFCWHAYGTLSASGIYFVAMNYSVHAVMYFYYFLTAVGYRPRWAQFVTIIQLSQMVVGVAVCALNVYYMRVDMPCNVDRENLKWGIIMYSSYFALFLKFFIERYFFKSSRSPANAQRTKKIQTTAMAVGGGSGSGEDAPTTKFADPDDATYIGRMKKTFDMLDFRTAFTTEHALADAVRVVETAKDRNAQVDPVAYEHALKITRAILHPDTGEPVLLPLRVSMIVPMNMLVDCGMIMASTTRTTIFAQWMNQTYNALHYYANRNASNEDSAEQRIAAYIAATASSVAASLGIRRWAKTIRSPTIAPVVARMGPFAAVAAADLLNLAIMRQSEYTKGVHVYDENGDWVGKSKRCGALAVSSCIAGRIFAAAPILIVPPLVIQRLDKSLLARNPWMRVPLLLAMVGTAIQFSVPVTFGLFRQTAQVDVSYLEPAIAHAVRKDGMPVRTVTVKDAPTGPPTAADLFNRQVDLQKIDFLNERMQLLQQENDALRERHEKREQETHEFVAYFQKEIQTRDKQITKLTEELAALKLSHALELEASIQAKEGECQQLQQHYSSKEEKFTEQLFFLKEEMNQLEMFKEMKESIQGKLKELDTLLTKEKESSKEQIGALERKFLEEKARLQKEHEKKIEIVKQQAKEDARNGLDADTRKIVTDNRRMGEELRFQLQITEELQKEKDFFKTKAKKYHMEVQIAKEKEESYAKRAQKQTREIKQLRSNIKELEKRMSESISELEREKFVEVSKNGKELEEMALDVDGLRQLLKLKNKELRNLRRLSQTILDQRTEVEQFFLDALDHVKHEIDNERRRQKEQEMERYHQELKKANAMATKGKTRFPQLPLPVAPAQQPQQSQSSKTKHFSEKIDLKDLSWEDRERVLRLVFAKINGIHSLADTMPQQPTLPPTNSTTSISHTPTHTNQSSSSHAVYFATEPVPVGAETHRSGGVQPQLAPSMSMMLNGMALTPSPPSVGPKQRHG
ncbi:TPA: hypothetical protein N0F65_003509, partial [Lagenidium giganteum]